MGWLDSIVNVFVLPPGTPVSGTLTVASTRGLPLPPRLRYYSRQLIQYAGSKSRKGQNISTQSIFSGKSPTPVQGLYKKDRAALIRTTLNAYRRCVGKSLVTPPRGRVRRLNTENDQRRRPEAE